MKPLGLSFWVLSALILSAQANQDVARSVRWLSPCARWLANTFYSDPERPVTLTASQLAALRARPEQARYGTSPLQVRYYGEGHGDSQAFGRSKVKYYREHKDRSPFRVWVFNNYLYDAYGVLLCAVKPCDGIYVMTGWGQIYFHPKPQARRVHHSSLMNGYQVAAAGQMRIYKGRIQRMDNSSGHYLIPWNQGNAQIYQELERNGYRNPRALRRIESHLCEI